MKRQIGVRKAFVDLFKQGGIYRGEKMLHYCPTLRSVLSDIEVDWIDISKKQKMKLPSGIETDVGVIYDIKYPIEGKQTIETDYILISTTRPETIFGDAGIAIHSQDSHHRVHTGNPLLVAIFEFKYTQPSHKSTNSLVHR